MSRYLQATLLLLCCADALADPRAVEAANFELAFGSGDTYISGERDSNTYHFAGGANLPLGNYFGLSLAGSHDRSTIGRAFRAQTDVLPSLTTPPSAKMQSTSGAAQIFLRDASIGRVGAGCGRGRTEFGGDISSLVDGSDQLETRTCTASAEYYWSRLTLSGSRGRTRITGLTEEIESAEFAAHIYPLNNARLSLSAGGLDMQDTYGVSLDYQPLLLTDAMSLLLDYSRQSGSVDSHFVMIGFSYRFGMHGELIKLDRQYR